MSHDELLQQRLGAEQLRHLLLGPYDYERKLLASPGYPEPGPRGERVVRSDPRRR